MEIEEYIKYRSDLLNESKDQDGFISESSFLEIALPSMLDAKIIDSENYTESYFLYNPDKIKINGYSINESGERLQLYIVNEESIISDDQNDLNISLKSYYENHFNRVIKFIKYAIDGKLNEELQDADSIKVLTSLLSSSDGIDQFDVIHIFLISATATIETRGSIPQPKQIEFDKETIKVNFKKDRVKSTKEISISKKLIDMNFLYNILISQGNREPLTVDFEKLFNYKIEAIKAADEEYFESYLCVLPGNIISDLYKEFSSRMLEKNVRSFLQFPKKGVNSGIKDTITFEPEKFIAYNNGLTITSTGKEVIEMNGKYFIKSLTDFQIVNGGQTTATIFFTQKEGIPVDKVMVMAKINIAKKSSDSELEKLITNISTFSNAQSRVSKVDLSSRSPQLIKIKALSDSIVTPKGLKWFFERSKGELNTIIRKDGNKERILKRYPKERRFSKEELAKCYSFWGNKPYLIKLGGEKVFREFIEEIDGKGTKRKALVINRFFYENLISRIILFRSLEKVYGDGKNKIGNLRAAVIPYSVSVIYNYTDGGESELFFGFNKIWINEGLDLDLADYFYSLMKLMNSLIKKYAPSDDPSDYAKRQELWENISKCDEIDTFMKSQNTKKIISKYTITSEEYKKRLLKAAKSTEVDFKLIQDNISIHAKGINFYNKLLNSFRNFNHSEKECMSHIISSIYKRNDIDSKYIDFEREMINKIITQDPNILDNIEYKNDNVLHDTLDYIIELYNDSINTQEDVVKTFNKILEKAKSENFKDYSIWGKIGELLSKGESPKLYNIIQASSLFTNKKNDSSKEKEIIVINEKILIQMIEWDAKKKVLSNNERKYLTDFAYGFSKINAFHENNIRRYLQMLLNKGFALK